MIPLFHVPSAVPVISYAETHYRFRFFPSLLRKREPEIVFDAPHRLDPGVSLPIVLLVKDAHRFPAELLHAEVTIRQGDTLIARDVIVHEPIRLREEWFWTICSIDTGQSRGWIECSVRFTISVDGKKHTYRMNNYRTASHGPLMVYKSAEILPSLPGFLSGEAHAHSSYTSDQVEFGLPLRPSRNLADAMGLGFLCITDHSYDLDDTTGSYLVNDPKLPKWGEFHAEIDELNADPSHAVIVRGEEVTLRNAEGRNVHCLVYGDRTFHPGSGDSAERWLRTGSEHSIVELLSRVSRRAGVFGAHIAETVPFLQRVLLGRGSWRQADISHDRLDGVQFWNGSRDRHMVDGKEMWIAELLRGRRIVGVAGNDAHGNFNRFLQLKIPFVMMLDTDRQLFGRVRTSVFTDDVDEQAILQGLIEGRSVMTDGPLGAFYTEDGGMIIGSTVPTGSTFMLRARSSAEFGSLSVVRILRGDAGMSTENCLREWTPDAFGFNSPLLTIPPQTLYLRAEIETHESESYRRSHLALTNPVWSAPSR